MINVLYDNDLFNEFRQFFGLWYDLFGVNDVRLVWFNAQPRPTEVEIILQIKEVLELDLSSETLEVDAVIDIEWFDPRLNWSGFCKDENHCPRDYNEIFECLSLKDYRHISSGRLL